MPSGALPGGGDVPAAPASKLAAKPDLEERFERLLESFVELKAQVAVVPDLQLQITKLAQQVGEEQAAKKELRMELDAANKALSHSDTRYVQLEKRVLAAEKGKQPVSYSQALGSDAGAALRKQQEEITGNMDQLQQQIERQERHSRSQNVMLFNLQESDQSPLQQVAACLRAAGVSETNKIVQAVRLGRDRRSLAGEGPSRPRPLKLVMQSPADAIGLLRHTRTLRQRQQVNLDRDLTPAQAQLRRSLQGAAKQLRDRGYATAWRGENLVYINRATNARENYKGTVPPPPPPA